MSNPFSPYPQHPPVERPPLLLEHLPHQPYELLKEVFYSTSSCESLKSFLLYWLRQFDHQRAIANLKDDAHVPLEEFYYSLLNLIDALQCIESEKGLISSLGLTTINQARLLAKAIPPTVIVRQFCQRYRQVYTRRELRCFLQGVLEYESDIPCEFQPGTILDWYDQVSGLTEVAYVLNAESDNS